MKIDKKYILIGIGLTVVLIFGINKWLKSLPISINSDTLAGLNLNTLLSKGSTGDEVSELQRILVNQYEADLGYTGAEKNGIDGQFGLATEKALFDAKKVKQISLRELLKNK